MEVHFKLSRWEKFPLENLPEELQKEILEKISSNEITSGTSLFEFIEDEGYIPVFESLEETDSYLSPEQNGGFSTIEVVKDIVDKNGQRNTDPIYKNGN